jgi:hypothetical protein
VDTPVNEAGRWASIVAAELSRAMEAHGIGVHAVTGGSDGDVSVSFELLADAETLMTLAVESDQVLGGLYDRATESCLSLSAMSEEGPTGEELEAVVRHGWQWDIHPAMRGRRMGWHVTVDMPSADAATLAANLNALGHGGAL